MSLLNKMPPHLLFNVIIRSKQYSLFKFCIPHFLKLRTWDQREQDVEHIIRAGQDNSLQEPEVFLECLWMKSWWTAGVRLNWPSLWGLILLCSKFPRALSGHSGFPPEGNLMSYFTSLLRDQILFTCWFWASWGANLPSFRSRWTCANRSLRASGCFLVNNRMTSGVRNTSLMYAWMAWLRRFHYNSWIFKSTGHLVYQLDGGEIIGERQIPRSQFGQRCLKLFQLLKSFSPGFLIFFRV